VVVEGCVETFEGFQVMKAQDGTAQEGENLGSAGFPARTRGVLFPEARVALPVVLVLHRPVSANGLGKQRGASLLGFETGDEVADFAFDFGGFLLVAFRFEPFAGAPDELAGAGKKADLLVDVDPGEAAALDAPVLLFPLADPLVCDRGGQAALGEPVEAGLVVLEPQQIVGAADRDYEPRFFWQFRASLVTSAPWSWPAVSLSSRRWATGSSQSSFLPL